MNITKANPEKPLCILIYGKDGLGKSSFGAHFPKPVFLGPEIDGADFLTDLDGEPVSKDNDSKTFDGLMSAVKELTSKRQGFETVVIDSLDWVEADIQEFVRKKYKVDNLNDAAGGYGGGYRESYEMQIGLMTALSELKKKMNVILVSHSKIGENSDVRSQEVYDKIELKLHESKNISPKSMWREFVDAVFFLDQDVEIDSTGKTLKTKFLKDRWLRCSGTERFDAKNRWPGFPDSVRFEEDSDIYKIIKDHILTTSEQMHKKCLSLYKEKGLEKPKLLEYIEENKTNKQKLTAVISKITKGEK